MRGMAGDQEKKTAGMGFEGDEKGIAERLNLRKADRRCRIRKECQARIEWGERTGCGYWWDGRPAAIAW